MSTQQRWDWIALAVALAASLAGCGTPGAPQPPSLNLPDRVTNLAATRTGNQVLLTWTMPKKNTDKLLFKGNIAVQLCRQEEHTLCAPAGNLSLPPNAHGTFTDTLPPMQASGNPRVLSYFVELKNRNGRSAGLSNAAVVLAGQSPAQVTGLSAEVRKAGVVLHWAPDSENVPVRLQRKLLNPPAAKQKPGLLTPPPELPEQNLLVEASAHADRALDKSIRFGETYEYRAQRVARIAANGQTLELDGDLSAPIRVEALDVFPPAVPAGLAAVATEGENGAGPGIDLSWLPDTEADLVGYVVYRRDGEGAWLRISPSQPVVGPAFHDAQVQPGHTYRYAVSAIDQGGHESARSAEAQETVPNP